MLRELSVQNLALIEDVRVELRPGFCAWTGETGAGKTLLLEALGLLLGERGSADLIRADAQELRVVGRFELTSPETQSAIESVLGFGCEDREVILARRLARGGRSAAYANDQPVAVATLRRLRRPLVDIHGQRESQSLLEPAYQLHLLDSYGGLQETRDRYRALAERFRSLRHRHQTLAADRQQRQRELALMRFEREELDNANLRPGEIPELLKERERLNHAQSLRDFARASCAQLYDDEGSIVEQLGKLHRQGQTWSEIDPRLADAVQRLDGLRSELTDLADTLRGLQEVWENDPERREQIDERLQLLRRLEVKYNRSVDQLLEYRAGLDELERRLEQQENDESSVQGELTKVFEELRQAGAELSRQRQRVAKRLSAAVRRELAELGMAEARLETVLTPINPGDDPTQAEVPEWGLDEFEFLLAANPGEPAAPLRRVASGGELSRTMLALKTVLAGHDQVETLVFDEIDANVGGRLGDVLGKKLAALARSHQVVCVTHLPQVASYARHQWSIRKETHGRRTTASIRLLDEQDRLEELASMLRGQSRGETTRQEAMDMLSAARSHWQ